MHLHPHLHLNLLPICLHHDTAATRLTRSVLPQVPGMYAPKVYEEIEPTRIALNETVVTTAAECAALVQRDYETAVAAEYSNTGHGWCNAVFEAAGVIYDPEVQTCLFE